VAKLRCEDITRWHGACLRATYWNAPEEELGIALLGDDNAIGAKIVMKDGATLHDSSAAWGAIQDENEVRRRMSTLATTYEVDWDAGS
jgi:hypothetical protein